MSSTALPPVQLKAGTHSKLFTCPSKVDGFINERIAAAKVTWHSIIIWITKVRCLRNSQKDRCQIVFICHFSLTYLQWPDILYRTNNSGGLGMFEGQGRGLMVETSGRATNEGSLSQDQQTWNRRCMYRTEQHNHSLQVALREYLVQIKIGGRAARRIAKWCPSHTTSSPPWWPGGGQATKDN